MRKLLQRIFGLVLRGVIRNAIDSGDLQVVQIGALADETHDDIERFQEYGFSSVPLDGAEAVMVCVAGRRDGAMVIAVDDRRYRLKGLTKGEVAIYTDQNDRIVIKRDGTIEVHASTKVEITAPSVTMSGDLTVDGTITGTTDVVGGGKSLKNHTHSVSGSAPPGGGPVVFVPTGSTGAPS